MSATVEFQNVQMSFEEDVLLKNINFQIHKGEKFVLIGPSGEGKSVLLKLMAGILKPSEGKILIEGHDMWNCLPKDRLALLRKMGMLFQKNALFDSLTVGENVAFPMREITQKSEQEIQKQVKYFLQEVDILHALELFPDEISGGMQKRLGIARALALEPGIIFYDDPTAGLDPITSRMIVELILRLQKELNSTIIAITNDMNRAYQMADRMAMVVDGELIITGNVGETQQHKDPRVVQFIHGYLKGPLTEHTEVNA